MLFLALLYLQYRAPFMPPTQQYPVTSGTASFYPGTSPAEYPYGEGFSPKLLPNYQSKNTVIVEYLCKHQYEI